MSWSLSTRLLVRLMRIVLVVIGFASWLIVVIDRNTVRRLPVPIAILGGLGFLVAILAIVYGS